ncbi:unnamed protein product [Mesocestoides corti]|uniref:Rho-related GTP-binding protein RhoU n=1 Tax=Mesocestoides corti TaxID=53468 RepID=A0A0R3U5Y6_MESCO|nr:unnamed protein product [Mesocestoides corti]
MSRKLVIVGDGMVGKTALLQAFVHGSFHDSYIPTVFETTAMDVELAGGRTVTLGLWDTGGQEEFDQIRQLAYPGARVILLCYAIDSETSLQNIIHTWSLEVRKFCPNVPLILVGCKSDLRSRLSPRAQVDPRFAVEVQKSVGALMHIECSAKTQSNVITVFHAAANATTLDDNPTPLGTKKSNREPRRHQFCALL